ncbi:MAG: Ribosomal protein S23 [Candidatus Magasanikbacteria bacterium GW2011_GWA2_50_22]|uniref:Ribosomal protein S23 n=1 Tax=Candidatus Magasanikbacteria bacterium GW2011_GWA2_50_22 TaxID=1619043 RepID=A0A0G1ZCL4_9BACT|nr:MAG: Ribosomal protein S23 [Candidatus Magasanikbacteria bacterium GW2011_GWA2_50_22]
MQDMEEKIKRFQDLFAWQEAHQLALLVYKISKEFPKEELFALTSQIRRAVISVPSNIAEGYGRPSGKDRVHFFWIAKGSLLEVESQFLIAKDLGYIKNTLFEKMFVSQLEKTDKILTGLIKKTR